MSGLLEPIGGARARREAAALLARAMADDPVYAWMVPDPRPRARWVHALMRASLRLCGPHVYGIREGAALAGAVALGAPGRWPAPLGAQVRAALGLLGALATARPPLGALARGLAAQRAAERLHPAGARWYACVLGVDPARKGRGFGGRLLGGLLALAREPSAAPSPIYLETTRAENVAFYERFGFATRARVALAPGGPTLWSMERPAEARHAASGGAASGGAASDGAAAVRTARG